MALIIGIAGILVNLPEKRVSGEEMERIESNIIYGSISLETKITPKKDIIVPKTINDTPKKKTLAREAKKEVSKKSLLPQSDIQKQVQAIAGEYGWGNGGQWEALSWIIQKESGWRVDAQNPTSTAFGLFQQLSATRKNYGCYGKTSVEEQTHCGVRYIKARYGDPVKTKIFWEKNRWY